MLRLASTIFSQPWAIDPSFVQAQFPVLDRIINGSDNIKDFSEERAKYHPSLIALIGSGPESSFSITAASKGGALFSDAPADSIAVIPIKGAMMKQDQFCGPVGTATISSWIKEAANNPNISSIILEVDTPGGTVDGTESLSQTIADASTKKPVVSYVDGMACSAGYWAISASDLVVIGGETISLGSIGTMCTVFDFSKMMKKMGVKEISTYAPESINKNIEYREAINGNTQPLESRLSELNSVFTGAVSKNRGTKINSKDKKVLTGTVYLGQSAIDAGLADEMGSFDYAIQRASDLSAARNNNSPTKKSSNNNTMKKLILKSNHAGLIKFFGLKAEEGKDHEVEYTPEQIDQLNSKVEKNDELQTAFDALTTSSEKTAADLVTANAEIERLKAENIAKNAVGRVTSIKKDTEEAEEEIHLTGDAEFDEKLKQNKAIADFNWKQK